jgi:hypothetical protein
VSVRLDDQRIRELLAESKPVPKTLLGNFKTTSKFGHKEANFEFKGDSGGAFRVAVRQNEVNQLDFSVILMHQPDNSNEWFRLRRYNGSSHTHRNKLENAVITGFHRHTATERYQANGFREDAFAEEQAGYANLTGAIHLMVQECGFRTEPTDQPSLELGDEE